MPKKGEYQIGAEIEANTWLQTGRITEADVGLIHGFGKDYMAGLVQPSLSTGLSS